MNAAFDSLRSLRAEPPTKSAEAAYLFRHALLRDAAYHLQLPGERTRLHALAFSAIEDLAGGPPPAESGAGRFEPHPTDPFAYELASHAGLAQSEGGPEEAGLRAKREIYLRRAAEHAESHFRNQDAERRWTEHAELVAGAEKGDSVRRAAVVAMQAGRMGAAEPLLQQALDLYRESGSRDRVAMALRILANLHRETGRVAHAEPLYAQALALLREDRNRRHQGQVLGNLGSLYYETGRFEESERTLAQALEIHREFGNRRDEGVTLANLSGLYLQTGRTEEAERGLEQALAIHREVRNRRDEGIVLEDLASVHKAKGQVAQAERYSAEALAIHREVGNRRAEGVALGNRANGFMATGRMEEAERDLELALAIHREVGNRRFEGVAIGNLAGLYGVTGRDELADEFFPRALAIHREVGHLHFEGTHLCSYAIFEIARGRTTEARAHWKRGAEILSGLRDTKRLGLKTTQMREACTKAGVPPFDGPASSGV